MARARWKLKYFSDSVWRKIANLKKNKKIRKRIFYDRSSSIPFCFHSNLVRIHKGKYVRRLPIIKKFTGKKFGEFSFTRKPFYFPHKKKKKTK